MIKDVELEEEKWWFCAAHRAALEMGIIFHRKAGETMYLDLRLPSDLA